jgi:hypothetical protein
MSVRSWLADPLAAGVCAGLGLGAVEVVRLGALGRPALALTALAVAAVTGALFGGVIAGVAAALSALRARVPALGRAAPLVEAAPSALVTIPLGGSLFQGAFAATLPGARWAPIAIPVLGWLATAAAIAVARAVVGRWRFGRAAVALALAGAAAIVSAANAVLFRSGYPTVHAALVVIALAVATLALGLGLGRPPHRPRGRWLTAAAVVVVAVATARFGLSSAGDRAVVATRGDQLRHLARLARTVVDLDRDGSSAILGGGDCDDLDPARHVGAPDRAGNGQDEDCDGVDAAPPPVAADDPDRDRSLAAWRARPEVAALRERTRAANLLVISIDTLRADRLRPGEPAAPHLDRFVLGAPGRRFGQGLVQQGIGRVVATAHPLVIGLPRQAGRLERLNQSLKQLGAQIFAGAGLAAAEHLEQCLMNVLGRHGFDGLSGQVVALQAGCHCLQIAGGAGVDGQPRLQRLAVQHAGMGCQQLLEDAPFQGQENLAEQARVQLGQLLQNRRYGTRRSWPPHGRRFGRLRALLSRATPVAPRCRFGATPVAIAKSHRAC